jgi:hypothetical protein
MEFLLKPSGMKLRRNELNSIAAENVSSTKMHAFGARE